MEMVSVLAGLRFDSIPVHEIEILSKRDRNSKCRLVRSRDLHSSEGTYPIHLRCHDQHEDYTRELQSPSALYSAVERV